MGADMMARLVFQQANAKLDVVAANAVISRLVNSPTIESLRGIVDEYDIVPFDNPETLRDTTRQRLEFMVEEFVNSLDSRQVTMHVLGNVWVHITGGLSWGDDPTEAFQIWDVLFSPLVLPEQWQHEIGAALGLMTITGGTAFANGTVSVNFRPWSAA